ncbi:MAG: transporter substrate-binding domain-containing protein [Nannocystaceae bacterium]
MTRSPALLALGLALVAAAPASASARAPAPLDGSAPAQVDGAAGRPDEGAAAAPAPRARDEGASTPSDAASIAQAPGAAAEEARRGPLDAPPGPLRVGTKEAPPFVVRRPDGALEGPTLELWRQVAGDLGATYTLEDGSLDVAVAALTITADRELRLDFSRPYHTTGLAIAVARRPAEGWVDVFVAVFNAAFLRLVLAFASLQLIVGSLMWLCERRRNPHFQGPAAAGLGAGLWWAVVTMATVGYGDKVPVTGPGRLLAMLWMLVSLIILTTVTASITTSLTLGRLEARIEGPDDLGKLRVGAIAGSTGEGFLREHGLFYRSFADPRAGLRAIDGGSIDALVHDEPILRAEIDAGHAGAIEILPRTFQRQDYAFGLPTGSPLREPINQSLARRVEGPSWPLSR